jgi:peptidoglycan/xylan/chitin deacetylase (PgdA/CDA1 family)
LQPGWYTVELGFGPENDTRKVIDLEFLDASKVPDFSVNLYSLPSQAGKDSVRILGVSLAREAHGIRWRKNQTRAVVSAPLLSFSIASGRPDGKTVSLEVIDTQWNGGTAALPEQVGRGLLRALANQAVSLRWNLEDGSSLQTPEAKESSVFLSAELRSIVSLTQKSPRLHLERYPERAGPEMDASLRSAELLPLFTPSPETVEIVVEGQGLDPRAVRLADFPGGARMAAVLSWDDGVANDKRAAELMQQHGWRASFFMNRPSLMLPRWQELEALGHEIGSHSWSHPQYWLQSPQRCEDESVLMRKLLEREVAHPVISFAYPFNYVPAFDREGDYVLRAQKAAGYLSGRSTLNGSLRLDDLGEPLALRTNGKFNMPADRIDAAWKRAAAAERGVFYLWGHTYEMTREADWKAFTELLSNYGRRPEVWYASQGDLMVWRWLRENVKVYAEGNSGRVTVRLVRSTLHPWWSARVPVALVLPGTLHSVASANATTTITNGVVQIAWPSW